MLSHSGIMKCTVTLRIKGTKTCARRHGWWNGNDLCVLENIGRKNRGCNADAEVRSHVNLTSLICAHDKNENVTGERLDLIPATRKN